MKTKQEQEQATLEQLANELLTAKGEKEELARLEKEAGSKLEAAKKRMVACLSALGVDSAEVAGYSFSLRPKLSVRVPCSEEEREAFFNYLRENGLFEQMISVNSRTLNSWYSAEMDAALENGDIDFKVPGLNNVSEYIELGINKKMRR